MESKEAARLLYLQGWEQKRIAAALEISENTVSKWKKAEEWERKRTEAALREETASERLWRLITHNLQVLEQKIETAPDQLVQRGDIDALYKLWAAVKGPQLTWTNYVTILREFIDSLQGNDLALAKQLIEPVDIFLNQKRREFQH